MSNGATIGRLKGDLLHWAFASLQDHKNKMKKYSIIGAEEFYKAGRKANFFTPYIHCAWGFFRSYIFNRGFLDGKYGFVICTLYAQSSFNKYKRLRILNKSGQH